MSSVSQSIQAINEAVDSGDNAQTLAALKNPAAGLYGVTSECAQTYQDDLAKIKEEKKKDGERTIQSAFGLKSTDFICVVTSHNKLSPET